MVAETSILDEPALVLNRNWQPIHVTSVRRALTLVCKEAARVVDPESYQLFGWSEWLLFCEAQAGSIRSQYASVAPPEVVALSQYDAVPRRTVAFSKRNVLRRDRFTCQYCGLQPGFEELSIDHVIPRSAGGPTTWENCVAACIGCNHRKANRSIERSGLRLRRNPVRPHWQPQFSRWAQRQTSWAPFLTSESNASEVA